MLKTSDSAAFPLESREREREGEGFEASPNIHTSLSLLYQNISSVDLMRPHRIYKSW